MAEVYHYYMISVHIHIIPESSLTSFYLLLRIYQSIQERRPGKLLSLSQLVLKVVRIQHKVLTALLLFYL